MEILTFKENYNYCSLDDYGHMMCHDEFIMVGKAMDIVRGDLIIRKGTQLVIVESNTRYRGVFPNGLSLEFCSYGELIEDGVCECLEFKDLEVKINTGI